MTDNLLIRVASHDNGVMLPPINIQHYDIYIPYNELDKLQELAARGSEGAQRFLELLAAVDFAGAQRKPVLLLGRKDRGVGTGFHLNVSIPVTGAPRNPFADNTPTPGG